MATYTYEIPAAENEPTMSVSVTVARPDERPARPQSVIDRAREHMTRNA
jgi:hypothetical protein